MEVRIKHVVIGFLLGAIFFGGCNERFGGALFKSPSPHEQYLAQLERADLEHTQLYRQWRAAAIRSLTDPVEITIPHQETAFIGPSHPDAVGYLFYARQGERLQVHITLKSLDSVAVFMDLFDHQGDTTPDHRHLISADSGTPAILSWDVRQDGRYLLRVQPELLAEVSFHLRITAEPSLANPVDSHARQHIGSVFGDARDGGARRHEGIDIFAARYTPVLAAADGTIGRVGDNRLGGRVVWLRPHGQAHQRQLNLYYAHLDTQLVSSGQVVQVGDTLGLLGNTGNAITTPPHLHFGIYGPGGAVDPLPFVQPGKSDPPQILTDTLWIGDTLRMARNITRQETGILSQHTPVRIEAALRNIYRVISPDGNRYDLERRDITTLVNMRSVRLTLPAVLYARPDTNAARIASLPADEQAGILAEYQDFLLIDGSVRGWIMRSPQ